MIKKILTVLVVTFAMANSFAYEGFKFDDTGHHAYPSKMYGNMYMLSSHFYPQLLEELDLSFDGYEEVLMDREAYAVLYNALPVNNQPYFGWVVVSMQDYIGITSTNGYWREYHLYKKTGEL